MELSADEGARAARRLVADLQIESVLDAGSAAGLVDPLRDLDVDASSLDLAAADEPLDRKYDLVVCVDVLEQVPPADAERVLENLCAAADRVLFSSTPFEYAEPTHVNVHAPEDWSAQFARQGFVRNLDYDATFLRRWAALYERSHTLLPEVVRA
ncbi:MAG TPA: methyltransferase type 12, partial [Acidimicrobiia bacterium]|nr:methyltransferase type 12 [Acidimicrobiia bacterium]